MANSTLSNLATRLNATAAAVATAAGGTVVTSDIVALAALLTAMALRPGEAIPLMNISTTPALAPTALTPG